MEVVMENRNCLSCGKVFRCLVSSKQKYHSKLCLELGPKWVGENTNKESKEIIVEPTIKPPPEDHKFDPWAGGFRHDKEKQLKKKAFRSPEAIEKRRASDRERKRIRNATDPVFREKERLRMLARRNDPAFIERERERKRQQYFKNKEIYNKKRNERRQRNAELSNERNRERYAKNKETIREQIYKTRRKRDPTIGLHKSERDFKNGSISLDELNRRISTASLLIDERANRQQARPISDEV